MSTLVNLNVSSQSEGGQLDILRTLCTAANSVSRTVDTKCWQLYNNYVDERDFDYLTKIGGQPLPAKFQHIPAQRPKINYLAGRMIERAFNFSVSAIDKGSLKKKNEQRANFYVEQYLTRFRQMYNQMDAGMQEIAQKKQEIEAMLQQQPQNDQEAQAQAQAKKALPQVEAQLETIRQSLQDTELFTMQNIRKLENLQRYTNKDMVEITAQKALKSFIQKLHIRQKRLQGFISKCVTGKSYYYVDYRHGDPYPTYRNLQGHNVFYQAADDVEWVQDLDWAGFEENMTPQDVISEFGLTGAEKSEIENFNSTIAAPNSDAGPFVVDKEGNVIDGGAYFVPSGSVNPYSGVNVKRVWWVAERKIKAVRISNPKKPGSYFTHFIGKDDQKQKVIDRSNYRYDYYRDENGKKVSKWILSADPTRKESASEQLDQDKNPITYNDDEVRTFDSRKGDQYVERYIYDRYKGVIINQNIFKAWKDPIQPRSVDNYSKTKLPIVGMTFNNITNQPYSLIWATKELQRMIDVVSWHKELMLALAGTKTLLYDMLFKPEGMSDKEYRYMRKMGDMPVQTRKKGAPGQVQSAFNQWTVLDLSLSDSIQYLDKIIDNLDIQMGMVMGISRQSMGEVTKDDLVGTMKMSQQSTMLITEVIFAQHDEIERQALSMLINLARQYLWDKNTILSYVDENNDEQIVDIPEGVLNLADFDILLANNNLEERRLNELKSFAMNSYAQGQLPFKDFSQIYSSESMTEVKRMSEYFSEEALRLQRESVQAERKHEQDLQQQKIELQGKFTEFVEGQKRQIEKMSQDLATQKFEFDQQVTAKELELRNKDLDLKKQIAELKAGTDVESTRMVSEVKQEHNRGQEDIAILKAKLTHIEKLLENGKQKADAVKS